MKRVVSTLALFLSLTLTGCGSDSAPSATTTGGGDSGGSTISIASGFHVLHSFAGGSSDGATVYHANLVLSGTTLYGTTRDGGSSNVGVVFSVGIDGTGFTLLHSFAGGTSDGSSPRGGLVLSGNTLYGTTSAGGAHSAGTIFSIGTDGTGFTIVHSFTSASEGGAPYNGLILSGTTLYGTASGGGTSSNGTVFKMETDGTGFTTLHSFAGGTSEGCGSEGPLTISGSTLYGMNPMCGANSLGAIFSVGTDGTGYTTLRSFAGGSSDGSSGYGGVIVSGSSLYGATYGGGSSNKGVFFKIGTDGTGFTILHAFTGTDGSGNYNAPVLSGSTIYGITRSGGSGSVGVIYSINIDGTGFTALHSLTSGTEGSTPYGGLILSGNGLFGMTTAGGTGTYGTVFSYGI